MNTNAKHKKFSRKNDLSLNKFYSFAPRFFEIKYCPDGDPDNYREVDTLSNRSFKIL